MQGDYFFYHHSDADTMEILDSAQMDRAVAMWAAYTYVVGNLEEMLPRLEPGEEAPTQEVCPHAHRRAASICWYGSDQARARPQQELDDVFGPVDLGAPAVCVAYLSAHGGCAISSAMGVGGVLLIGNPHDCCWHLSCILPRAPAIIVRTGAALGVAVGGCVARACGPKEDANAYKKIEMGRLG